MEQYILKLDTGSSYKLYKGTTLLTDAELTTLFSAAGSAYFSFDFDGGTPASTTELTIINSSSTAVITNTGLTDEIVENKNFKGNWSASATAFDTFVELDGKALDESQVSFLMGKIKEANAKEIIELEFTDQVTSYQLKDLVDTYGYGIYRFVNRSTATGNRNVLLGPGNLTNVGYVRLGYSPGDTGYMFALQQNGDTVVYSWYFDGDITMSGYRKATSSSPLGGKMRCSPIDNLTSNSSDYPLSANQGRVLNNKILGISSGTSAASWTTIGTSSKYTKRALQVTVNINETSLTLTANDWNTLFTLPSGYRPASELTTGCTMTDNGTLVNGLVKITTAGLVQVMAGSNTTEVYGLLTIPVAS